MPPLAEAVEEFLAQQRIAVAGVSRTKTGQPANLIYRKLKSDGHAVFAVNPAGDSVEGDACYPDLKSIPGGVDAVVIATQPAVTPSVMEECVELNIPRAWIHRSIGMGSGSDEAVALGKEHGVTVIPAGCPLMYCDPDPGHACMRWFYSLTGKIPKQV